MGNKWLSFSSSGRSSETMSRSHLTRPPSKLTFSTAPPKDSIFCPKKILKSQRTRKRSIFFLGTLPRGPIKAVPSTLKAFQKVQHWTDIQTHKVYHFLWLQGFPTFWVFICEDREKKAGNHTHGTFGSTHIPPLFVAAPLKLPSEKLKRKVKIGRNWAELTVNPIGRAAINYSSSSGLILHEMPRCFQIGAFYVVKFERWRFCNGLAQYFFEFYINHETLHT